MFLSWWRPSKLFPLRASSRQPRRRRASFQPLLEALEQRWVPTTFTVTTAADTGAGSLRQAILAANANPGADTITFNLGTSVQTIQPASALPSITDPVTIAPATGPGGSPLIVLDGAAAGASSGLTLSANGCTIKGLAIDDFQGDAIKVQSSGNVIQGNYLGTDVTGSHAHANMNGIEILGAANNTIGGTATGAGNVISGNKLYGVVLSGSGATGNVVLGNRIGTNGAGNGALGNGGTGVLLQGGASNNTIGSTVFGAGNAISGNSFGILIQDAGTTGNVIVGNRIGCDVIGTIAVPNTYDGVYITGASGNTVGGTTPGTGNVISGNGRFGVFLLGQSGANGLTPSSNNLVQDNLIGIGQGANVLANTYDGVTLYPGATGNTIGGPTPFARNLISGNGRFGVYLYGSGTTNNVIQANFIGTNVPATSAQGNAFDGVAVFAGPTGNTIGGTVSGAANTISGNGRNGIFLANASGNLVQGNLVGTSSAGTASVANGGAGIEILGASANTLGGTTTGAGNVISGNHQFGVRLSSATNNVLQGNFIGVQNDGTSALGNGSQGILLDTGAANNAIGGTAAGAGNVIAFNTGNGVLIGDDPSLRAPGTLPQLAGAGNSVLGNSIHDNSKLGIDLGNQDGVTLNNSAGHTGPNDFQNFPVINSALLTGTINFTLNSTPDGTYRIEFFANSSADPSGFGEGQFFLGAMLVTVNGGTFTGFFTVSGPAAVTLSANTFVTATATAPDNSTSEFSAAVQATMLRG
jgi:titin